MDYTYIKDATDARATPVLTAVDVRTSSTYWRQADYKGRLDTEVMRGMARWLLEIGRTGPLRVRSDPEPSILSLVQELARIRGSNVTVVECSPVASKGSLGSCERAHQSLVGLLRTLKAATQERHKAHIPVKSTIMAWLVQHVAWVYNHCQPVNGTTPYESIMLKPYAGEL